MLNSENFSEFTYIREILGLIYQTYEIFNLIFGIGITLNYIYYAGNNLKIGKPLIFDMNPEIFQKEIKSCCKLTKGGTPLTEQTQIRNLRAYSSCH